MPKYKITVVKGDCIGCGACEATCPDNWKMTDKNDEMKASPKKIEVDELGCNMDAAESCPSNCIHIIEIDTGKKMV